MPNFNLDDYVPVHERVVQFRAEHPTFGLGAEIVYDDGQRVVIRASVTDDDGRLVAQGHAEEIRGLGNVNKTSAVENCETSAWGRALAAMGYHVSRGIASREEMRKATSPAPKSRQQVAQEAGRLNGDRLRIKEILDGLPEDERKDAKMAFVAQWKGTPGDIDPFDLGPALEWAEMFAKAVAGAAATDTPATGSASVTGDPGPVQDEPASDAVPAG